MRYNLAANGDEVRVRLSESLSFDDHEAFREVLTQLSAKKCKRCVFDLRELTSVDSAGLGMLMIAYQESRQHRYNMVLQHPTGQVKRLLQITDLGKVIDVQ